MLPKACVHVTALCFCTTNLYSNSMLQTADTVSFAPLLHPPRTVFKMQWCSAHLSVCWSGAKLLLSERLCVDCSILCYNYINCDANDSLFYGQSPHVTWELFWTTMLINFKNLTTRRWAKKLNKKGNIAVWVHNISRPILTLPQLTVS